MKYSNRSRLCAVLLVAGIVSSLFCSAPSISAQPRHHIPSRSGISGQVFLTHYCPGPVACPPRPYETNLALLTNEGEPIRIIKTDSMGRFKIALKAGNYILQLLNPSGEPHGSPVSVTVNAKETTTLTLEYNMGLR